MDKYTFKLIDVNEGVRTIDYIGNITLNNGFTVIELKDSTISMKFDDSSLELTRLAKGVCTRIITSNKEGTISVETEEGVVEFDIDIIKFKKHNENLVMEYKLNDFKFQLLFGRIKTYGNYING